MRVRVPTGEDRVLEVYHSIVDLVQVHHLNTPAAFADDVRVVLEDLDVPPQAQFTGQVLHQDGIGGRGDLDECRTVGEPNHRVLATGWRDVAPAVIAGEGPWAQLLEREPRE